MKEDMRRTSRARRAQQRKRRNRRIALTLCVMFVVLAASIGGTVAWLTDKTGTITNTFTTSNIDIDLTESENLDLKMVPGNTIMKDPKVTVNAGSEACWLFVKVVKSDNFDGFMTYEMADDWTLVPGETNVYYRTVGATTANTDFAVIKDNQVTVRNSVTKADMNALTEATYPKLTFTAYAVQQANVATVADAWALAKNLQ